MSRLGKAGLRAGLAGALVGMLLAVAMTWQDYQLNPGGLFHDEAGPKWDVVLDTAFSWFWPVALGVAAAWFLLALWVIRGRQ